MKTPERNTASPIDNNAKSGLP